jgi:carbon storage regulator
MEAQGPKFGGKEMLVLSRKPGQRVLIGDDVAVTVVRIGPNTVRLGIDAPRNKNIVREELCIEVPVCDADEVGVGVSSPAVNRPR